MRNFNTYYENVARFCEDGFPEWAYRYEYALIFWEPSHEYEVQLVRKSVEDEKCKIRRSDVKLASNQDPEFFEYQWKHVEHDLMDVDFA